MTEIAKPLNRILRYVIGIVCAAGLTFVLLHFSRFWLWVGPWGSDGLLGFKVFLPYGNMVNWWLRGTWLQDFDFIVWGCGAFLLLTAADWLLKRLPR
jgi:hypothetical protein